MTAGWSLLVAPSAAAGGHFSLESGFLMGLRMRLAKYVKFREEKFGAVLFETRSEKVFTLNPTAAAVVRELEAGRDEASIVAILKERFNDVDGSVEREVLAFIADLRQKGLLDGTAP
jgi:Coenzyme PQQ synthesis protein D (PqqD)